MATEATLVDNAGFSRLLEESPEKIPYEMGGYLYLTRKEKDGWVTYRTYGPKWVMLYQARRVLTSPVGGGVLAVRISVASGTAARINQFYARGPASAGATMNVLIQDEDSATAGTIANCAAGANNTFSLPSIGSAASVTSNHANSVSMMIGPGQFITTTASASLATETLTIGVSLLLPMGSTVDSVIWDTTGSVAGGVLAASTISAANTMQAVLLP